MARLEFTPQLQRFGLPLPVVEAEAPTLAALLELAFAQSPRLRPYLLDDQGRLRDNVAAFVDGRRQLSLDCLLRGDSRVFLCRP